jgi:hypothetical protein
MKNRLVAMLSAVVFLAGCGTGLFGTGTTGPDFATRILATLSCAQTVSALVGGLQSDPDLGAATATDVSVAIGKIGDAAKVATANAACAETLKYAVEDFQGLIAMNTAKATPTTETVPQRKARLSKVVPKPQNVPVKVHIPLK